MRNMMLGRVIAFLAGCGVLAFASCKKDERGSATLRVLLKDAPAVYQEVRVEVLEVQVHSSGGGWTTVDVADSVYDLVQLRDSAIALLGQATLQTGTLSQVRLILGEQNSVMADSVYYPLSLSSQDEAGLKLNIHQDLTSGMVYTLVLDFDAAESVVDEGSGSYRLKPVIRASFVP